MLAYISSLITCTAKVLTFKGFGYRYFFKRGCSTQQATLQIKKAKLDAFVASVGKCNSTGMPELEIISRGRGWYLVSTKINPFAHQVADSVIRFLGRLNKWAAKKIAETRQDMAVLGSKENTFHKVYGVLTRAFGPGTRPINLERELYVAKEKIEWTVTPKGNGVLKQTVEPSKLLMLAQTVNHRYGH